MGGAQEGGVALVSGANQGIGLEIVRQLAERGMRVLLGALLLEEGEAAAQELRKIGLDVRAVELDVRDESSMQAVMRFIEEEYGRLDALVNNAAVLIDLGTPPSELGDDVLRTTFDVDFFGPFRLTQLCTPLLRESKHGRIVNLSSTVASLTELADPDSPVQGDVCPAYQASKNALNSLTVLFARELRNDGVKVNSACPGWVMTDMGKEDLPDYGDSVRPKTPAEGADTPVWLATLPDDGPTGGFFSDRQPRAW